MDITLHQVPQQLVNQAVTLYQSLTNKAPGHNAQAKMPAPVFCPFMPYVQVSLIDQIENPGLQCMFQPVANLG